DDRAPDIGIAPIADSRRLARGDVARRRNAPRPRELAAALAERIFKINARSRRPERRMAFHAMGDGDEIEAALHLIVEVGFGRGLLGAGKYLMRNLHLVDRAWHLIVHRRQRTQINNDAVEVGRGQDAGVAIGRDVGRGGVEGRLVETQLARQRLVELRAVRSLGGMAVLAGPYGSDGE